jgi:hypothetical protein
MTRNCLLLIVAVALAGAVACGDSGTKSAATASVSSTTSAASPASAATLAAGDPLDEFKVILDALNRRDADAMYARFSVEARKDLTAEQARSLVKKLFEADANFRVSVQTVNSRDVTDTAAQLGLTLLIDFQGKQFPLTEVAYLVVEDGIWKLSDHFLQTALAAGGAGPPPAKPRTYGPDGCAEGDVLAGVYLPSRLQVLEPCVTVTGVVLRVELPDQGEGDGDLNFDIDVSGDDRRLLNDANLRNTAGGLHIEIVPQDRAALPTPQVGQRVRVQGPWVLDLIHGHNEIHPVWSVVVLP